MSRGLEVQKTSTFMNKTPLTGLATPEQLKKWKAENPAGIYGVECDGHIAYFREPTRQDVNAALSCASDNEPLAAIGKFMELTMIGGSGDVKTNDLLWLGVGQEVKHKMRGKEATLVNL
jgi:hypothetical protein